MRFIYQTLWIPEEDPQDPTILGKENKITNIVIEILESSQWVLSCYQEWKTTLLFISLLVLHCNDFYNIFLNMQ